MKLLFLSEVSIDLKDHVLGAVARELNSFFNTFLTAQVIVFDALFSMSCNLIAATEADVYLAPVVCSSATVE